MSADADRYHQIMDEYEEASRQSAVPVDPEVIAILRAWREGGTDLPWQDAAPDGEKISSEEETMGWQVIKQPDGKFGVFSSNVDDWVATDCTADEVEELFAEEMGRDMARRLRDVRRTIALVDAGEARKAYYQFAMTFEEADALAKHGPECEDDDAQAEGLAAADLDPDWPGHGDER